MIELRQVVMEELPQAVELARRLTLEGPRGAMLPGDPIAVEQRRRRMSGIGAALIEQGAMFAGYAHGSMISLLGIQVTEDALTGDSVAQEVVWYIEPNYRRGTLGRQMLRLAEAFARRKNCSMLQIAAPVMDAARVARYYTRRGYLEVETLFAKEL